jgi:hypothetical protein
MQSSNGFYINLREYSPTAPDGYVERRWRVSRARLPQNQHQRNWGNCCHKTRSIVIHTPLSDEEFYSTLDHEIDHVSYPYLDEPEIMRGEYNRLQAMRRLGVFSEDD